MKTYNFTSSEMAEKELEKANKKMKSLDNKIRSSIELDEFLEENNFWTYMMPAAVGLILGAGMLLAQTFMLSVALVAGAFVFGPALFGMANDVFKQVNVGKSQNLEKEIRTLGYHLDALKRMEEQKQDVVKEIKEELTNKTKENVAQNKSQKVAKKVSQEELNA